MKPYFAGLVSAWALLTVGTVGSAAAETQSNIDDAPANPLVTPWARPQPTYRMIDPGLPTLDGDGVSAAVSNVIYLNNCKPNGCAVTPGNDNAMTNRSSIPSQSSTVTPFAYSDSNWQLVVDCVKATYAPFGVQIVTERPATGNYHMAIVAGRPGDVQMQNGVGGVSPFSCGYIPNAISFSFANIYGGSVDDVCWTVAQETAHSWGLDHKFDNKDPMTYLQSGPSRKSFQNMAGPCGENSARSCQCGGSTMNSFQAIMQTFGSSTPTPPTVAITAPKNGDIVPQGFAIRADIMDDVGASKAELRIDGNLVATVTSAPWVFNAPMSLGQGNHTIKVTGFDIGNTPADATITVSIGAPCTKPADCSNDTDTCVDGRCVAGAGVDGGLGDVCATSADCKSGQCGNDGQGNAFCVEACDPAKDACPSGFGCIVAGTGGVCWPGAGDGGGCSTNNEGAGLSLFGLSLGALLLTRRRRR
jgi:hypothetical protein